MKPASAHQRLTLIATSTGNRLAALARDVRQGLTDHPKHLSCCYFYDAEGSLLFEEICALPEYYLTRAEREILAARAGELTAAFPGPVTLVELGSGSAAKTRLVIEALLQRQGTLRYVPIDICRTVVEESSLKLLEAYPGLRVLAIAAEYQEGLRYLQKAGDGPRLILWLGSNIGNLDRADAGRFLGDVGRLMTPQDRLLVGIDLRKDRAMLEAAYDDKQGVTAEFNLNLLARINRELGGHFDREAFAHRAVYHKELGRVEMYLVSKYAQRVRIDSLDLEVSFTADEAIHTENSYKYAPAEIEALAAAGGLRMVSQWRDAEGRFSVTLFGLPAP